MKSNYQMLLEIKHWKPQQHMLITEDEANFIVSHFRIKDRSDIELQNLRDFVVLYYGTQVEKIDSAVRMDEMDKMSAITYMIDEEKYNRGMEV